MIGKELVRKNHEMVVLLSSFFSVSKIDFGILKNYLNIFGGPRRLD